MQKILFILLGSFSLALGVLGIFLPLLPTTPFLLLAAWCFSKGSEKFHSWLLQHRILGPPILDWKKNRAIKVKYKVLATLMISITCVVIYMKTTIPLMGKTAYFSFVFMILLFIWSRKSRANN